LAVKYLFPQSGQLNHPYDEHPYDGRRQNLRKDRIASINEPSDSQVKKSGVSTLGNKSPNPSALESDSSLKMPLVSLNPGSIIQGVIFSEIIGKPRCFKRKIR
jgi:hypothetical protein